MRPQLAVAALAAAGVPGRVGADAWKGDRKYGNGFAMRWLPKGTYIARASYSVTPPRPPCNRGADAGRRGQLAIWIGLQDNPGNGSVLEENFVQPVLIWGRDRNGRSGCRGDRARWCASTSTYTPRGQVSAGLRDVPADARLDVEIIVDGPVKQTIYVGGSVFSTQTDSSGMRPGVLESQNECLYDSCGTVDGYVWSNLTVVLNAPAPDWGKAMRLLNATSRGWHTADGGVTWTNAGISVAKDYLYRDNRVMECT